MSALFADTSTGSPCPILPTAPTAAPWISHRSGPVIATDEVLAEFLTFFATAP
jgi:hypothetical protein